jgi:hypothetical protein
MVFMSKKPQVFNRKGKFEARNQISGASRESPVAPRNLPAQIPDGAEASSSKEPVKHSDEHIDTESYVLRSCRLKVLKPDPHYLENISARLATLEKKIQHL